MHSLIVTLDGPVGSGKSTVARRLAARLGLEFLDTGAMYRGLTAVCLDRGSDPGQQPEEAVELARKAELFFDWQTDPPRLHVRLGAVEHDVTDRLRDADVTQSVSEVSSLPGVRQVLVREQQRIGRTHPRLVTEGRDQGSVVFPDAAAKFYLDASPQVRGQRRAAELQAAGKPADAVEILKQITARDHRDANRKDGPLICPTDAIRIDTTAMTLEEVVELLEVKVREKAGSLLGARLSPAASSHSPSDAGGDARAPKAPHGEGLADV